MATVPIEMKENKMCDKYKNFWEILTAGLLTKLENMENVCDVRVEKRLPCSETFLQTWQQNRRLKLPCDLHRFYLSTDGFKLTWSYKHFKRIVPVGEVLVHSLSEVRELKYEIMSQEVGEASVHGGKTWSRAFTLAMQPEVGTVAMLLHGKVKMEDCLGCGFCPREKEKEIAKRGESCAATIWILDMGYTWHFLAPDFATYFRMALGNMGVHQWQHKFTKLAPTPSALETMNLINPPLQPDEDQKLGNVKMNAGLFLKLKKLSPPPP